MVARLLSLPLRIAVLGLVIAVFPAAAQDKPRESTGLVPLTQMSVTARYKGEDGGLYGHGENTPPEAHRKAAETELAKVVPRNADGQPVADGTIGFVSISMSNATQEFQVFKQRADADRRKSPRVTIVDCAQGGQAMAQWVDPKARPWLEADRRLVAAKVSPQQVQVAWIKLANIAPHGELADHGRKLEKDARAVIQNAIARFPNLHVVYLGSRIYAGYSTGVLNPEPYAYESAFAARWLIQDQMKSDPRSPILLWGPYLWADGTTPRKPDGLVWKREDLAADGVHPTMSGREKVAKLLLDFFTEDSLAKGWFVGAREG